MSLTVFYFFIFTGIFIILGWALYIVYKFGQLNNMPIVTMAIGAYVYAYLSRELDWPFILILIVAIVVGAIFSFILALGLARAPAFSMTIATIAMIFIAQTVLRNIEFLGGAFGFFEIPRVRNLFLVTYGFIIVIGLFIHRLETSRIGRAIDVAFVDRGVARTLGIKTYWLSVVLQVVAGVIGIIAGILYANLVRYIVPRHFSLALLLSIYTFFFVGGYSTMWGVIIITPILWGFPFLLPEAVAAWKDSIFGLLLIVVMLIRPEGLIDKRLLNNIGTKSKKFFKNFKKGG